MLCHIKTILKRKEDGFIAKYAILRFAKSKGGAARQIEAHHERQKTEYISNPDIRVWDSKNNYHLITPAKSYFTEINNRIKAAGCKTRKDSTRFVDTLITASPSFFKNKTHEETRAFFERALDFLSSRLGKENIVSAVVHLDEVTPHLHMVFVPLTKDKRLCAKEILGGRADLSRWQDDFHAHMVKDYPDLERGEPARETGRRHIPMRVFKQSMNLSMQAEKVTELLEDKNPLTANRRQQEAITLLNAWFPQMENFEESLKKYQRTIDYLQKENAELAETIETNRENKMQTRFQINKLQSEVKKLQKFKASVPEEIQEQIATTQEERKNKESR